MELIEWIKLIVSCMIWKRTEKKQLLLLVYDTYFSLLDCVGKKKKLNSYLVPTGTSSTHISEINEYS